MNSKLSEYILSEEQLRHQQTNGSVSFYNDHFAHLKGFTFEIVTKDTFINYKEVAMIHDGHAVKYHLSLKVSSRVIYFNRSSYFICAIGKRTPRYRILKKKYEVYMIYGTNKSN